MYAAMTFRLSCHTTNNRQQNQEVLVQRMVDSQCQAIYKKLSLLMLVLQVCANCMQEVGETASGGSTSYEKLYIVSHEWQANSKAIAAVLASPMLLEYKADTVDYVISGMLLGLTAASALVPVVIPAVAGVAVACYALRCVPGQPRARFIVHAA